MPVSSSQKQVEGTHTVSSDSTHAWPWPQSASTSHSCAEGSGPQELVDSVTHMRRCPQSAVQPHVPVSASQKQLEGTHSVVAETPQTSPEPQSASTEHSCAEGSGVEQPVEVLFGELLLGVVLFGEMLLPGSGLLLNQGSLFSGGFRIRSRSGSSSPGGNIGRSEQATPLVPGISWR